MFLRHAVNIAAEVEGEASHVEIVFPAECLDELDWEEVAKHLATGDVVWPGSQTIGCLLSELKRHIEESNKQWRASILGVTFPKARSETLISLLADLSSHPDEIIRSKALSCLKAIDSPAAIEALKKYKD